MKKAGRASFRFHEAQTEDADPRGRLKMDTAMRQALMTAPSACTSSRRSTWRPGR